MNTEPRIVYANEQFPKCEDVNPASLDIGDRVFLAPTPNSYGRIVEIVEVVKEGVLYKVHNNMELVFIPGAIAKLVTK